MKSLQIPKYRKSKCIKIFQIIKDFKGAVDKVQKSLTMLAKVLDLI